MIQNKHRGGIKLCTCGQPAHAQNNKCAKCITQNLLKEAEQLGNEKTAQGIQETGFQGNILQPK